MNYQLKYALSLIVILVLIISGCVYFPKPESDIDDRKCQLVTRSLTLDVYNLTPEYTAAANDMHQQIQEESSEAESLVVVLLAPIAISAGSLIVSGSIVVAGNTVHWIEKQGKCDASATHKPITSLVDATKVYGGKAIKTGKQLVDWLEEQISSGGSYEVIEYEGEI